MSIHQVTFLIDDHNLGLGDVPSSEDVQQHVVDQVLVQARAAQQLRLHSARANDELDGDVRTVIMAEALRGIMLTFMMEANLIVQPASPDAEFKTHLPPER